MMNGWLAWSSGFPTVTAAAHRLNHPFHQHCDPIDNAAVVRIPFVSSNQLQVILSVLFCPSHAALRSRQVNLLPSIGQSSETTISFLFSRSQAVKTQSVLWPASPPSLKNLLAFFASHPSLPVANQDLLLGTTSSSRTPTQLPPQPKKIILRSFQDTKPSHFPLLPLLTHASLPPIYRLPCRARPSKNILQVTDRLLARTEDPVGDPHHNTSLVLFFARCSKQKSLFRRLLSHLYKKIHPPASSTLPNHSPAILTSISRNRPVASLDSSHQTSTFR